MDVSYIMFEFRDYILTYVSRFLLNAPIGPFSKLYGLCCGEVSNLLMFNSYGYADLCRPHSSQFTLQDRPRSSALP